MIRSHRDRSGAVLICVLTCLLVVSGLAVAMLKSALQARQAVRLERHRAQAELLLEAGILRAVDKLSHDAEYRGEVWELPAATLSTAEPVRVEIDLATTSDEASAAVSIVVQYPAATALSIRRSYNFPVSNVTGSFRKPSVDNEE